MEREDEIAGIGNHYLFGSHGYDSRIGRRWDIDPYSATFPSISPYLFASSNPIFLRDADGNVAVIAAIIAKTIAQMGVAAGTEMIMQMGLNYLFDDNVNSFGAAFESIDWWDVGKAACWGAVSVPGGKYAKAFAEAAADVASTFVKKTIDGESYSTSDVGGALMLGFVSELTADKFIELLSNKKARAKLVSLIGEDNFNKLSKKYGDPDLELARGAFSGGIQNRKKLEKYALATKYKGYKNANVELRENNPTYGLFQGNIYVAIDNVVDVTSTAATKISPSQFKKKMTALSGLRGLNSSSERILQIYVPKGKYTSEQLNDLRKKLDAHGKSLDNKVQVSIDEV